MSAPAPAPAPASAPASFPAPASRAPFNVLAILGFVLTFFVTIAGIVLGFIALAQIRRTGARGRGLALAAVILGFVLTLSSFVALFVIAFTVFIGQGSVAKDSATESGLANAKIAMLTYGLDNNGVYPAVIEGLASEGWTPTPATADARIIGGGAGGIFCIEATSQAGHVFHLTQSSGVQSGACSS
jgi:type II secretory pathway pseudopilin PulG